MPSLKIVQDQITKFLGTETPEVLALRGHWGVGKTFAWNKFLQEAKENNAIALKKYSYVSLFGINSLDDLKYALFEEAIDTSLIGTELQPENLLKNGSKIDLNQDLAIIAKRNAFLTVWLKAIKLCKALYRKILGKPNALYPVVFNLREQRSNKAIHAKRNIRRSPQCRTGRFLLEGFTGIQR